MKGALGNSVWFWARYVGRRVMAGCKEVLI